MAAAGSRFEGRLILLPWHIGDRRDVTLHALQEIQRLRVLICEDPDGMRRQLAEAYQVDCRTKHLTLITHAEDPALLGRCREWLKTEDVGLLPSSGAPCFVDPGAWLVRALRSDGVRVIAPSGGSALTSMLSLSGIDWSHDDAATFTFCFFTKTRQAQFKSLLENRRVEAILVFLAKDDFPVCLEAAAAHDASRLVTAFFDLSKTNGPLGDHLECASAGEWRAKIADIAWGSVSDVAILIHGVRKGR